MDKEIVVAIATLLTPIVGLIMWTIRRQITKDNEREQTLLLFMESVTERTDFFMRASNDNSSALISEIKELTKVVNNLSTQNAVVVKTMDFLGDRIRRQEQNNKLLFQKTAVLEKDVATIAGVCRERQK